MAQETGIGIIRIAMGLLFLIPGFYKVFMPADFIGFLREGFPKFLLPVLPLLFWGVTAFEILGGVALLVGWRIEWVVFPLAAVLLAALVTVVIPDAETAKIGLINIAFHVVGIATLVALFFTGPGRWALRQ